MPLTRVYLGLGSNVQREAHLCAGLDALAGLLSDMRCSPVFESHAVGIKSGNFFNLVVVGETELPLLELDRRLKFIEADNGRTHRTAKACRWISMCCCMASRSAISTA